MKRIVLYRWWQYFRQGYGIYLSLPVGILNFLTITYYLSMERISWLKVLLPQFSSFMLLALITVLPIATLLGWLHMKRTKLFSTEQIVITETNPITVHCQRVGMEMTIKVLEALKIPVDPSYQRLYEYWKHLDEKAGWMQ